MTDTFHPSRRPLPAEEPVGSRCERESDGGDGASLPRPAGLQARAVASQGASVEAGCACSAVTLGHLWCVSVTAGCHDDAASARGPDAHRVPAGCGLRAHHRCVCPPRSTSAGMASEQEGGAWGVRLEAGPGLHAVPGEPPLTGGLLSCVGFCTYRE